MVLNGTINGIFVNKDGPRGSSRVHHKSRGPRLQFGQRGRPGPAEAGQQPTDADERLGIELGHHGPWTLMAGGSKISHPKPWYWLDRTTIYIYIYVYIYIHPEIHPCIFLFSHIFSGQKMEHQIGIHPQSFPGQLGGQLNSALSSAGFKMGSYVRITYRRCGSMRLGGLHTKADGMLVDKMLEIARG